MRLTLVGMVLLLMVGCAKQSAGISIDSSNQNVVLSDLLLSNELKLGNAKSKKEDGRLTASVLVTNTTTNTQYLQYRFYWYDELGLELNSDQAPWQQFILYGGDAKAVQGVAVDTDENRIRGFGQVFDVAKNPVARNFRRFGMHRPDLTGIAHAFGLQNNLLTPRAATDDGDGFRAQQPGQVFVHGQAPKGRRRSRLIMWR